MPRKQEIIGWSVVGYGVLAVFDPALLLKLHDRLGVEVPPFVKDFIQDQLASDALTPEQAKDILVDQPDLSRADILRRFALEQRAMVGEAQQLDDIRRIALSTPATKTILYRVVTPSGVGAEFAGAVTLRTIAMDFYPSLGPKGAELIRSANSSRLAQTEIDGPLPPGMWIALPWHESRVTDAVLGDAGGVRLG